MPQMYPLNWISLFFLFTLIFMFFNIIFYFQILYTLKQNKNFKLNNLNKKMNWKW
uniref:ATP synthase complex subunit 8 n=1 Tax=Tenthredo tienmushana TaxID=1385159 RepID=A0A0U2E2G5_9HYME|nr:ATP synthase FO subunit 8 [Tenthredo tienmushana]